MPNDRDPLHLDERTARLGRELFENVRAEQREVSAEEKRRRAQQDDSAGDGLWDALFGDGDGDADAGGDD